MTAAPLPKVLLVEDDSVLAGTYLDFLENQPVEAEHVTTGRAALERLDALRPGIMLLDLGLPDMHGRDVLRHISENELPTLAVVITGQGSIDTAVEAMRGGAYDFLVKPFNFSRLSVTIKNALEQQRLTSLVKTYERDFSRDHFHGFVGASLPMQAVYRVIESAGPSSATVFITGESGTGKEICAQAIHESSARQGRPFVVINCGAIPSELMESEIFGHTKGAFTGAIAARDGAAKRAHGGTLFLDEICDMDPALQAKLLRFVQTGIVQPVGSDRSEKVDVRIICATNKDPVEEVEAGTFREDLYYRVHVIPIHLPPLREREADILPLANHFLQIISTREGKGFKGFSPEVDSVLLAYGWPGNVRQLENVVHNIVVLHDGETVTPEQLPAPLDQLAGKITARFGRRDGPRTDAGAGLPAVSLDSGSAAGKVRPLWMVEREAIEEAVALCDGSILKAASLLGIDDSTIYRKRRRWGARAKKSSSA